MPKLVLHTFNMGDVDDVELYVAQPIYEWQQTEQGKWCMSNAKDPHYITAPDPNTLGYRISIVGELEDKLATEYLLRWNNF